MKNPEVLAQPGRPAKKRRRIVDSIRADIVNGTLAPECTLPVREDLRKRFGVSHDTVQAAMDRLVREGFIQARRRIGTSVVSHPPHLYHYAVVFPAAPSPDSHQGGSWRSLWEAANEIDHDDTPRRVRSYFGVLPHSDNDHYRRVSRLVRADRLAGLIFPVPPYLYSGTPLLEHPRIGRAALTPPESSVAGVSGIHLDYATLYEKAIEYLKARGRRRLAVISYGLPIPQEPAILRHATQAGMTARPDWRQAPVSQREAIHACVMLMFNPAQLERPDALIVLDDTMASAVTQSLVAAGVRVPEEVEVVAHCNFPRKPILHTPACQIGFDARKVMDAALRLIGDQLENPGQTPGKAVIRAEFG